ncbi:MULTISPECIES: ATP-binding cassette domain-containing protein [Streptomyces]|uniref:ATP-binding cassette domain-containing protein n=1 Tax=Streptomyces siderophoricus TaxID=2802281 RepID=A0ABS1MZY6_9ACTN|nr:ATP-binding cassette domain-containing protein [Streptomyces sp. 9-7]MBL1093346.1 ATP-binding cassette domain-containing protein [Streptomyces sp. 9-7]
MTAFRLLWTAADHPARRDLLIAAVLAGTAELCAAGLLGVSGWFLTSCAVVTAQANTTWSWMYPSGTVRALALGRTGLRYSERLVSHGALLGATVSLRSRLVRAATTVPARELRNHRDGALMARLTSDVGAVGGMAGQVVPPLAGIGLTAAVVVTLLTVASPPSGAAELLLLALSVATAVTAERRTRGHQRTAAEAWATARAALLSARSAWWELRCLDAVDLVRDQVADAVGRARRAEAAAESVMRRSRLLLRLLAVAGQTAVLVLALSGPVFAQPAAEAIGEVLLVAAAYELVETLPQVLRDHGLAADAAQRLTDLANRALPGQLSTASPPRPSPAGAAARALVARQVPVGVGAYRTRWSAVIAPGSVVLVTGPNGSGKSTLLETLAGRISPAVPRSVLLGGVPVESLPARAIADSLTLVEAEDWIADATIAENLRQAAPGADDDTLRAALEAAALEQLSLDTPTGPLGSALSQGQRRRLVIARAVLRTPAVLLLDEPTAGLDDRTAMRMLTGVRRALPDSALVIALPDRHDDLMPFTASRVLRLKPTPRAAPAE